MNTGGPVKTPTEIIADAILHAKALGLKHEYDQALTVIVELEAAGLRITKRPTKREAR
jgi:hypothetical protein